MLLDEYDYETDIEVQREEAREQGRAEGREEGREQGRAEGRKQGKEEGREEGRKEEKRALVQKKLEKGKTISQIADDLEDTEENIAHKVASYVTDFPSDDILGAQGVIAIPHLGASTPESEDNCAGMAAKELIDYIENGNIVNSVNLPEIVMPRSGESRICVIHKNIPNMLTAITGIFAGDNVNIENLLNKSRGDYAYTMLDVSKADVSDVADKIGAISGVIRVRVI